MLGLRSKDGSINRAKDDSPLRVGTLRSLLRSYKTQTRNIFQSMFRQAQHDTRCCGLIREFADSRIPKPWFVNTQTGYRYQTTCSTHTPANNAALKALAIAKGGITVVPNRACELSEGNVFSGEVMEECIVSTASMSSLRSVWALFVE